MAMNYFGYITGIEEEYIHIGKRTAYNSYEVTPEERAMTALDSYRSEYPRWKSFRITPELFVDIYLHFLVGQYVKVVVEGKQAKTVSLLTDPITAMRKIGFHIRHDFLHFERIKISANRDVPAGDVLRVHNRKKRKPVKYTDIRHQEQAFLDLTMLTAEEFHQLVPAFEKAFQEHVKEWCLSGKKRIGRRYVPQRNTALPTPEDRLLFILVYLRSHSLQESMQQIKDDPWIYTLLLVLQTALKSLTNAENLHHMGESLHRLLTKSFSNFENSSTCV